MFVHYAVADREGFGRTFMLAREMAIRGHRVTMLTGLPTGKFIFPYKIEERDGVTLYAFPDIVPAALRRTGFGALSTLLKIWFALSHPFDFVHGDNGHRPSSGWPCKINRLRYKSKYISEWWDYFGRGGQFDDLSFLKKMTKGFYDLITETSDKISADHVVTLSSSMAKRARQFGIPDNRISVIRGGCDTHGIRFNPDTGMRKQFGLPENTFLFGFIGMNEGEFHDIVPFVKVISRLKKNADIGWFTTGRKISEQVRSELGIERELTEFGWVDYSQYSALLSCADAFVLLQQPNLCNETRWPNKAGDYLAAGRVILVNNVGDVGALCREYPQSVICTAFDEDDVERKIMHLIENRSELMKLGIINRMAAEGDYSWSRCADKLEAIYDKFGDRS